MQTVVGNGVNAEAIAFLGKEAKLSAFRLSGTVYEDSHMRFRQKAYTYIWALKELSENTCIVAGFDKMKAAADAWENM